MNKAYLLTGGNLGNRLNNLVTAGQLIEEYCGKITQWSSVYETAAWGVSDQPDFYNQAIALNTGLTAQALMHMLLVIEGQMGRKRDTKMGPRTIDIDILLYNDAVIHEPDLVIPHERLPFRKFALMPLAEIAPEIIHPLLHKSIAALLNECTDTLDVHKIG